jgi:RpiR family carbohydrate utilization transcriptional regulator
VNALERVNSIEFFGYGASGIVALDAPQKFPLFDVPCGAQTDANRQIMRVAIMGSGEVAARTPAARSSLSTPPGSRAKAVPRSAG